MPSEPVELALALLTIWILLSGLDDLIVDGFAALAAWKHRTPRDQPCGAAPLAAIFIPAWRESAVIGRMVRRNVSVLRYPAYHIFIGVYPNDLATRSAVEELERDFPNVHAAVCPHDGPTSKADCLNWVYQRMLQFEAQQSVRFELTVVHDAEDLMAAGALTLMARESARYGMIQVPVLPLPTPALEWTHGLYCDDFAESTLRDMPARSAMKSFVPSCGVGTGYTRAALETLAAAESNRIFEPGSLTEDYENGIRLRRLGVRQVYVPLRSQAGSWLATREYFPRDVQFAIRQRTRWVTGIALQAWQRYGWRGSLAELYWFWRDRKGLLGNPLSLLANVLTVAWAGGWLATGPPFPSAVRFAIVLACWRLAVRSYCTGKVYGWRMALLSAPRVLYANLVNSAAVAGALYRFARARLLDEPLVWLKTAHMYPSAAALDDERPCLREVLLGNGYVEAEEMERALAGKPEGIDLGAHLVACGILDSESLCDALSLQQGMPVAHLSSDVSLAVLRSFPRRVLEDWQVLPFKIEHGAVCVAGPRPPHLELEEDLKRFTKLEIRFHLIRADEFKAWAERLSLAERTAPTGKNR